MQTMLSYGHWGIHVIRAGEVLATYNYPVGTRGPIDSAKTERQAIEHCQRLGGEVKGPFFYKES